jgi:hypothetical protein
MAATYSVLQSSLDQAIPLAALEEAADVAASIVRTDMLALHRDLFGIIISSLPPAEAHAVQATLMRHGFPTEIVADDDLPLLHEPFTIQRIDLRKDELLFTDMMGCEHCRPLTDLVFAAGGFLDETKLKTKLAQPPRWFETRSSSGELANRSQRQHSLDEVRTFRLDFFFHTAPNRLRAAVSADSTIFFQGRPVRLRDTALLLGAMMDLRQLLPRERLNLGLLLTETNLVYPSRKSYEEEIRWHFHQLTK